MQLVAYGAQDIYLTGNPSITFWKIVYRRHTQFSLESIEQTFNGAVDWGKKVSVTVSRNGDLVSTMWLEIKLKKASTGETYYPAEAFVKEIELELGGQRIDKVYSDWYRIYDELFRSADEKAAYRRLTDFDTPTDTSEPTKRFYLPLIFSFNRHAGLALPLIALQYHELKLHFTFASQAEIGTTIASTTPQATLYCTYVFLDTDERRRYAQSSHEYLITQLQHTGSETVAPSTSAAQFNIRLNLNHPVKYLAWVVKHKDGNHGRYIAEAAADDFKDDALKYDERYGVIDTVKLQLNGHDRFSARRGSYFNLVQPFEHLRTRPAAGVYLYSFALKPEEHQPSGTCNFSRIDNATLIVTTKACSRATVSAIDDENECLTTGANLTNLLIFGESYNVLRVLSGMGGLALIKLYLDRAQKSRASTVWVPVDEKPLGLPVSSQRLVTAF